MTSLFTLSVKGAIMTTFMVNPNRGGGVLVFHSVLGLSGLCGLIQHPPPQSSNIQEPRPIRVKKEPIHVSYYHGGII